MTCRSSILREERVVEYRKRRTSYLKALKRAALDRRAYIVVAHSI